MAAPVIASESTFSGSGTTHNLAVPLGMVQNDVDLIFGNVWGSDGDSIIVPAGYTLLFRQLHSSDGELTAAWRYAPASPATVSFSTEANLNFAGRRLRITGADLTAAINGSNSARQDVDDPDSPSVTTTLAECLGILILADTWGDADTYAEPAGTTQQGTNQDQSDATLCLAFFTQTLAGATGAKEWTGTSGNDEFATGTIMIAPPGGGGGAVVGAGLTQGLKLQRLRLAA